jgi:hypothetical protein
MAEWRNDPKWALVQWDKKHFDGTAPPDKPPKEAELSSNILWCDLYVDHRIVATWGRPHPSFSLPDGQEVALPSE